MRDLFRVFGRIGLLSFGGPAGQIALMHRVLVEEKRWLSEEAFLHALNFCMLLPGPEAMQLATYAGWLKRGTPGAIVAGLLFVLPGAAVLIALSAVFFFYGSLPVTAALFAGLSAAVIAIVCEALIKVSKRALRNATHVLLAFAAFVAIAVFQVPFPAVVAVAAVCGLLLHLSKRNEHGAPKSDVVSEAPSNGRRESGRAVLVWGSLWVVPLALLIVLMPDSVLTALALFFSKAAAVTFGGAYAVLAYAGQQAVDIHGWLKPGEMVSGLGLAETTPGPLILVLIFVGFLGSARLSGLEPLTGGLAGSLTALWFTFVPCFLWILAGAPLIERVRGNQALAGALSGVTAAVVGVIANLALWFAMHVLFRQTFVLEAGFASLTVPDIASFDWKAALIAGAASLALIRFKINLFVVLAGAALAGLLLGGAG